MESGSNCLTIIYSTFLASFTRKFNLQAESLSQTVRGLNLSPGVYRDPLIVPSLLAHYRTILGLARGPLSFILQINPSTGYITFLHHLPRLDSRDESVIFSQPSLSSSSSSTHPPIRSNQTACLVEPSIRQQMNAKPDSDSTSSSKGVDYYLKMYFEQSYDGLSAHDEPHRIPTRIAGDSISGGDGLLGDDDAIEDGNRIKFDGTQLASILFGTDEEEKLSGANCQRLTVDRSPGVPDRLTREAPAAPAEASSSGRWEPDGVTEPEGQQALDQPIPPAIRNIQHQHRPSQSQTDEPERSAGTLGSNGATSRQSGTREKITQTQTQNDLSGDSSKKTSCSSLLSSSSNNLPTRFHQDLYNPFISFPPSSAPSPAASNHHINNNSCSTNNIENFLTPACHHTSIPGSGGTTAKDDDIKDLKTASSSTNLLSYPISSLISADGPYQFTPHLGHPFDKYSADCPFSPFHLSHHPHSLNPIRPSSFDLLHQMNNSPHPHSHPKTHPVPLDLSQFWSTFTPSSNRIDSAFLSNQVDQLTSEDEDRQQPVELEFSHLVAEEQCAPSTPLSSSSFSYEPVAANTSENPSQSVLRSSPKSSGDIGRSFVPSDPLSSLLATTDQGTSIYPHHQPLSNFQDLCDLNDTFHNLINSFDLISPPASSAHRQSISSSGHPPPLSAGFLSTAASTSSLSTPTINPAFGSHSQTSPAADHILAHHKFGSSIIPANSPLPSPSSLSYPSAATPQSSHRDRFPSASEAAHSCHPPHRRSNPIISRSASHSALNKSIAAAAAEVPTEVELAIPRLNRLNLLEPYPDDLKLLLVGLQAEGAKTRVETQIKLTLVLVTGEGASIDRHGNLSTPAQHTLSRLGNWSHIKLPVYSAIKRKSKKLIKTGIPPEETLFLDVAVVRESEPHEEIYCCSNCQVREQKRLQRKRDARVRPAQEIESDEAEQSTRPEDEKRKIVVFNCGQYVTFDSGEVTLPTRITCYCRHHREKKGFRVKITLRDHTNRFVATSTSPAIMITDDHKAVAAAAKAKSGSDAEDIQTRNRIIRKLPYACPVTSASGAHRIKKKGLAASIEATPNAQLAAQDNTTTGWTSLAAPDDSTPCLPSHSQGASRSISMKCKRKAPEELNPRANIGRRTGSNPTATSNQLIEACDNSSAPRTVEYDLNYQVIPPPGSSRSLEESRPQLPDPHHSRSYDRNFTMPMPIFPSTMRQSSLTPRYQWEDCSTIARQSYEEGMPYFPRADVKPTLSVDVEMKDPSANAAQNSNASMPPDKPVHPPLQPVAGDTDSKSNDHLAPSEIPEMTYNILDSRDHSSHCDQAYPTPQHYQATYKRAHLACSTTTSSPDQMLSCPFGSRIATPPPSGSSQASPKSSVDFPRFERQTKFSNSTSRSSSIVCTRRTCSDGSSNTSELDRTICILPSQSENSPDHVDTRSSHRNDVSRGGSPMNNDESLLCNLGNSFSNWNVLANILPKASVTRPTSKSSAIETPVKLQGVPIDPTLKTDRSGVTTSDLKRTTRARISKLVPNEGPVEGGIEITILGDNFDQELRVDFEGCSGGPVRPEFWSPNTLVCILPPSAGPGPCSVALVDGDEVAPHLDLTNSPGSLFRYVSTADQRLMEVALQVVGLKMTGQVQDAIHFARRIVAETNELDGLDPPTPSVLSALIDRKEE
ncbi:hypothetical protein VP01_352g2 [Puccinia sorghi]|uniref:IPT/TIG domain-containing protein n=1 Tax=Puccinia sorghi TaxID=27349 RepID=A0A0L6UWC7_9BASI|nr:hypothetical protein VP01_352g2 [Puccinia sorghi]